MYGSLTHYSLHTNIHEVSVARPQTQHSRPPKHWETFEQAVASIQRLFSPSADVRHNERIRDSGGRLRQFDVVIRGEVWGQAILGVMECRDKGRPIDIGQIDGFIAKASSVNAHLKAMVSRAGFTKDAIARAKEHNIGTFSLMTAQNAHINLQCQCQCYVNIYHWSDFQIELFTKRKIKLPTPLDVDNLTYRGANVAKWFLKQLSTKYLSCTEIGQLHCVVEFNKERLLSVNGVNRRIAAIRFSSSRKLYTKSKYLQITGQAFYDWQNEVWLWPSGGFLITDDITSDFSDWDEFQGDNSEPNAALFGLKMNVFKESFSPDSDVIDLDLL